MGTTQDDHTQMFAYGSSIFVKEEPEPEREAAWWRPLVSYHRATTVRAVLIKHMMAHPAGPPMTLGNMQTGVKPGTVQANICGSEDHLIAATGPTARVVRPTGSRSRTRTRRQRQD
jgi:hypothetical protein